ncbi:hypothetical protein [Escherichia coli]|uniref:hypothetical protein n=1 Tax=Escherichia coli TaxID=562 RepID=UPI001CA7125A|nr:hypothetical protein [Escherichia coli]QZY67689.1 hypothetical protein K7X33_16475 [Escherichia coli]
MTPRKKRIVIASIIGAAIGIHLAQSDDVKPTPVADVQPATVETASETEADARLIKAYKAMEDSKEEVGLFHAFVKFAIESERVDGQDTAQNQAFIAQQVTSIEDKIYGLVIAGLDEHKTCKDIEHTISSAYKDAGQPYPSWDVLRVKAIKYTDTLCKKATK